MAANGSFVTQDLKGDEQAAAPAVESGSTNNSNLSKDEVGWYFVEQYYTTLSKTPEKLHLFYGKRSQFVYGKEAEVATVSVGRAAIQERIKELDFQDCKVRVTNVDSMASFDNIVIQVIGETSNRNAEPSKFCQTFVLAPQPSGYFVVNDILRFISEDEEEEVPVVQRDAPAIVDTEETQAPVETEEVESQEAGVDADAVDEKLEEQEEEEETPAVEAPAPSKPEVAVPEIRKVEEPVKAEPAPEVVADPEVTAQEIAEEDIKEPEKPVDPSPTPTSAPPQAVPAPAPVPSKPLSWASRAAAAASIGPKPVVPAIPKTAAPSTQSKPAAPKPAAAAVATPASGSAPAVQQPSAPAQQPTDSKESSEWQSVSDSKRQNRPQSISGPPADNGALGYVKYVTDKVDTEELRAALQRHGELTYFDVNRQKNCAFVEFATAAGYQAAVAANPHVINGENIVVEPRRPKAGAYGGSNYASGPRNVPNRGRGGFDGPRSGSQSGGRGNFAGGQGRGRGGAPRGRGASQATTNA